MQSDTSQHTCVQGGGRFRLGRHVNESAFKFIAHGRLFGCGTFWLRISRTGLRSSRSSLFSRSAARSGTGLAGSRRLERREGGGRGERGARRGRERRGWGGFLVKVFKVCSVDRVQQRFVDQVVDVLVFLQVVFQQSRVYLWMVPETQFIDRVL